MPACPNCFEPLPLSEAWFMCKASCPEEENAAASSYDLQPVRRRPITKYGVGADRKTLPRGGICHRCQQPTDLEVCPRCAFPLPAGWRTADTTTIAMSGAVATGKSLYIGTLGHELVTWRESCPQPGSAIHATQQSAELYDDHYEKPLFYSCNVIGSTPPFASNDRLREPLIWSLGTIGKRQQYLVLRDVAGEDIEHAMGEEPFLQFFQHADAVLFLFDPLAIPSVSERLEGLIPPREEKDRQRANPVEVLPRVFRLMRGVGRLGLVISKFDALQYLGLVEDQVWRRIMNNHGAAILRDPTSHQFEYDAHDGALLHEEVRSLLLQMHAGGIVQHIEAQQGIDSQLFAVSALGIPPTGLKLSTHGIMPFRVMDPIRWVLSERSIIPTANGGSLLSSLRR